MEWNELRDIREELLNEMDRYQLSIRYDSLSDTQRGELQQYRQELLDLPQDNATPELALANIPTKLTWMA
jgi:hypothetical protein